MKTLYSYIHECSREDVHAIFEDCLRASDELTLTECFERIGDCMLASYGVTVNEGLGNWFRKLSKNADKLGKNLAAWGDKADAKQQKLEDKISSVSSDIKDAVLKARDNIKKKAGDAWKKVGNSIETVIGDVAAGVDKAKDAIEGIAAATKTKVSDLVTTVTTVVSNGIEQGKEAIANAVKEPAKMAAIASLIGSASYCVKNGIDILEILVAAGINA